MKGEEQIIELLMRSLQNQEVMQRDITEIKQRLDRLEERAERTEERIGRLEERFNKMEWRQDDLNLKHEELRYSISQTQRQVNDLTQAVATLVNLHTQVEVRVRRLERPDDTLPGSQAA